MKSAAHSLLFFGIGSIVLRFMDMQFIILAWVDMWGDTIGWAIRGAMIAAGVVLYFIDMRQQRSGPLTAQPR